MTKKIIATGNNREKTLTTNQVGCLLGLLDDSQILVVIGGEWVSADKQVLEQTDVWGAMLSSRMSSIKEGESGKIDLTEIMDMVTFKQVYAYLTLKHSSTMENAYNLYMALDSRLEKNESKIIRGFLQDRYEFIKANIDVEFAKSILNIQETETLGHALLEAKEKEELIGVPKALIPLAIETLRKLVFGVKEFFKELTGSDSNILLHEVELPQDTGDSIKTCCAVLSVKGVKSVLSKIKKTEVVDLKAELNSIFDMAGVRKIDKDDLIDQKGVLVNLDLAQQIALISHLVEHQPNTSPELKEAIGLYNLRASIQVYQKLKAVGLHNAQEGAAREVLWFWTGEKWVMGQGEEAYPGPHIISINHVSKEEKAINQTDCFCVRYIDNGYWDKFAQDDHIGNGCVVVAGPYPSAL